MSDDINQDHSTNVVNERSGDRQRTLLFAALFIITLASALSSFFGVIGIRILSFFLIIGLGILSYYFFSNRIFGDRKYNKYEKASVQVESNFRIINFVALGLFAYFIFTLLTIFFQIFTADPNMLLSAGITLVLIVIIVKFADFYAGKDVEMYVDYKDMSHKRYVDSLGTVEGKCMSCQKKIDLNDQHCPFCGFKQRKIETDKGYIHKK